MELIKKIGKGTRSKAIKGLAGIVAFATSYSLIMPAITIDQETAEEEPGMVLNENENTEEVLAEYEAPEEVAEEAPVEEPVIEEAPAEEVQVETQTEETAVEEVPAEEPKQEEAAEPEPEPVIVLEATAGKLEFEAEKDYKVTIEYTKDAGFTEGTELEIRETLKEDEYANSLVKAQKEFEEEEIAQARFFEAVFKAEGEEYKTAEGKAAVTYEPEKMEIEENQEIKVLVLDKEDKYQVIDKEKVSVKKDEKKVKEIKFETEDLESFTILVLEKEAEEEITETPAEEPQETVEETEETVAMPAASFTKTAGDVTVTVEAPEGAFPDGTEMEIELVDEDQYIDAINETLDENEQVKTAQAVDIRFIFNNEEIEPKKEIKVRIISDVIKQTEDPKLIHIDDEGSASVVDTVSETNTYTEEINNPSKSESVESLTFTSDEFSVYVVVETETMPTRSVGSSGLRAGGDAERTVVASGTAGNTVTWTLYDDGEVVFTGTGTVSRADSLLAYSDQVKRITIDEGMTGIGTNAFANDYENLESVSFPRTLESLGQGAFASCTSLKEVDLSNTAIRTINVSAFRNCTSLQSADLSGCTNLVTLGNDAFGNCSSLESLNVSGCDNLKTIGSSAFSACTSLVSIDLSGLQSLTTLQKNAFNGCSNLKTVDLSNCASLKKIGSAESNETSIFLNCTSLEEVKLEGTPIELIGHYAFQGCTSLKKFDFASIKDTLKQINYRAFYQSGLNEIDLGDCANLQTLQKEAFNGVKCETLNFSGCTSLETVGDSCFYNNNLVKKLDLSNCTSLKSIGVNAFAGFSALESINLTNCSSLETVGDRAFSARNDVFSELKFDGCSSLKTIGTGAFQNLALGKDLEIDLTPLTSLETIGESAFSGNKTVGTIVIPSSVKTIGKNAFYGAQGYYAAASNIDAVDFSEAYNLETIGEGAFRHTKIRTADFNGCANLKTIGDNAFDGCNQLQEIDLSDAEQLESISKEAFKDCGSATYIVIPKSVTSIDESAFTNDAAVTKLLWNAEDYNRPIGSGTFNTSNGFSSGFELVIGEDVNALPEGFFEAVSCGDVYFRPNSRIDMSAGATQGAPVPISNIDGPCYVDAEGVVYEIEGEGDQQYARVAYCPPGIDNYTIPAAVPFEGNSVPVKEIGNSAFVLARDLEEIKFEDASGITTVGSNAFYGVETLTKVTDNRTGDTRTTISGAIDLFTGASAPRSAFLKTGLEDDTDQIWKDGNPVQSLNVENDNIKVKVDRPSKGSGETGYTWNETEKRYEYYTGAYLNTNVSATNTGTSPATVRIYLNYSNDAYEGLREGFSVGDTNPISVEIKETSDPDVKYLEFTLDEGKTVNFSLVTTYPSPDSAGGDLHLWVDLPEEGTDEPRPLTSTDDYMAASWTTQRQERNAVKTSGKTGNRTYSIHGDGTGSTNFMETHLWKISLNNAGETAKNAVGKDYCESVLYKDQLVLPEGWKWSDELLAAIADHKYGTRKSGSTIYYYIIKEDGSAADVCSIKIPNGTSKLEDLTLTPVVDDDNRQNIEFSWKLRATTGEYPTDSLEFSILEPFLEAGDLNNYPTGGYVVKNNVKVLLDYAHSADAELESSASTKAVAGEASLKFTKSRSTGTLGNYTITMGKKHTFYLDVSNTGTRNTSELCTITDPLNEYMYIQAPDMEQMFSNNYGDKLVIKIEGAQLFHAPQHTTAVGIDGSVVSINAANSSHDVPDSIQKTITIRKGEGSGYIISVDGVDHSCTSLQAGLDSLGYVVTPSARYSVEWTFNPVDASITPETERFTVFGGMAFRLPVYVTHKNTFELLDRDWLEFYDFPNYDAEYIMTNTAVMVKADHSTAEVSCPRYLLKKDVSLTKSADRNGVPMDNFATARFKDGDVITYHVKTVNRGASIHNLPVVDNMSGAQFMLVPVNGNLSLDWGDGGRPDIFTDSDGVQYYRLDRTAEYHNVVTSAGIIADTITVRKHDDGWNTDIKWYYPEFTGSYADKSETTRTISYKALVESSNITFNLSNFAYLNDRYDDRLYIMVGGGGSSVGFDKQIVTKNPNYDGTTVGEECDPKNYSALTKDNHDVVYKLTISGEGAGNIALSGKDFFDRLPQTFGVFEWSRDNVEITCRSSRDELVLTEGLDDWEITQTSPNPSMWPDNVEGQYYIRWPESTSIRFAGLNGNVPSELYLYVTLHYTDDWSAYSSKAFGTNLINSLYVNSFPKIVTHDVLAEGNVIMQKGVHAISHMGDTNSRVYFEKENSSVSYYIVLYNGGITRFYLNDIVDTLPEGFSARGFNEYSQYGNLGSLASPITTPSAEPYGLNRLTAAEVASITLPEKDVVYRHAKVYGVNDAENHVFTIHFAETSESDKENGYVGYDPNVGKVYLEPNEAVVFKYIVNIDPTVANDEIVNTNRITMDYYDPNSVGVTVNKDITITAGNTTLDAEPNDGNCVVVNRPEGGKQLVSEVSIRSGEILPGVSKSVTTYEEYGLTKSVEFGQEAVVSPTANLLWEVRSYNEGTKDINGYKIKDNMQAPYRFSGDVKYIIYDSENSTTVDAEPRDPVNNISRPLFTIIGTNERSDGTGTVSIRDLVGNEYTLELGGEPIELALPNIYLAYHGKSQASMSPNSWGGRYYNVGKTGSVRVSFAIDKNTKAETMLLEFPENTMSIYPGCVGKLTVWTNTPGNTFVNTTYVNTADLIPDDKNYESSMINHGNPAVDNEGRNDYVESYGFVTTASGYASSSRKHVTEKLKPENTAHSYEPVNYITLSEEENGFTYTLEVDNINDDTTFDKITIVDNLPKIGDGYTLRDDIKRNSQYEVKFADDPNVTLSVLLPDGTERTLDSEEYTVKYSDKQVLDLARGHANDWNPDASTWGDLTDSSRSILVNFVDDTKTVMVGRSKIRVSFDAVVSGNVEPGLIAYNSFAYNYEVEGIALESSPLIVGTRIKDYPYIQKVLVDKKGNSYTTERDLSFRFLVFKGDRSIITDAGDQDLQAYLAQQDIPNHVFDVTVREGESSSDRVRFSPTNDFVWENQQKYTVIELPSERAYVFNLWKNGGSGAYTFTYNESRTQVFTAENVNIEWDAHLLKVDAEDGETPLKGAVFARYSSNQQDAITDEAYNALKSAYSVEPDRSYVEKDSEGNDLYTWYLADAKETGRDGTIDWENLVEDEYDIVEVKAPDGYIMLEKSIRVSRHDSTDNQGRVVITAKNKKAYELPMSGGSGILPYTLGGLILIILSASMYGFMMRRRERRLDN